MYNNPQPPSQNPNLNSNKRKRKKYALYVTHCRPKGSPPKKNPHYMWLIVTYGCDCVIFHVEETLIFRSFDADCAMHKTKGAKKEKKKKKEREQFFNSHSSEGGVHSMPLVSQPLN